MRPRWGQSPPTHYPRMRVFSLCSRCDHTVRGYPLPTPHRQGAGISDSATRPSADFEDEVVLEEFRADPVGRVGTQPPYPSSMSRATGPQDPAASPAPLPRPAHSRPGAQPAQPSLPHAAARSAQDPDTPPPPGLHAPSPLTAATTPAPPPPPVAAAREALRLPPAADGVGGARRRSCSEGPQTCLACHSSLRTGRLVKTRVSSHR